MNINKITQAIGTVALICITAPALADDRSKWYLGAGGGFAFSNIAQEEIIADLLSSGFVTTEFSENDRDFGYKIFAGYQFSKHFAVEGGYFNLGEFDYTATTMPAGTKTGTLSFSGLNLDLVGTLPLTDRSSLIARIGLHEGKAKADFIGTGAVNVLTPSYREKSVDYKVGIGYQFHVNNALSFRVEAERYRMDDAVGNSGDIDLVSASILYRFGARKHLPVTEPVQEREPIPTPVPPVVATEQYCSALEMQFEIGNENIERINRERILVLATFLNKYAKTNATIEGHTDSVGTDADNQQLSQQRAQSVLNYLVQEHGIARNRLTAIGYGETRPIADNSTVAGQQANRRIKAVIDCAQDIAGLDTLPARTTLAMTLEFDETGTSVHRKYHNQLESVAKYLQANPNLIVTLEGHADNANPANAQAISRQRAQSVADYLVSNLGVDRSRLNVEGFGATRRDTYNITAANRQENRRVNIVIGYPN